MRPDCTLPHCTVHLTPLEQVCVVYVPVARNRVDCSLEFVVAQSRLML